MNRHVAIVAAVVLIAVPLPAQAQQRYEGQPSAGEPAQPPSFRDRFAAANTTNDGCLTLEQAQHGLAGVAGQFNQIDREGRGCVTLAEIKSFRQAQNAKLFSDRFAAANTTNDGCLTRDQAEHGVPVVARQFSQIDTEGRGCVTLAETTAFLHSRHSAPPPQAEPPQPDTRAVPRGHGAKQQDQPVPVPNDMPPPPAGY